MRQALFNSLQMTIPGARVLDLFAGSGALGFEALSRGADSVVFVENGRAACKLIERNAAELGVKDRIQLLDCSVEQAARDLARLGPFDVVMADPPYAEGWEMKLLAMDWSTLLHPKGILVLEWGTQKSQVSELPESTPHLVKAREKNYGDSVLTTYRKAEASTEAESSGDPS